MKFTTELWINNCYIDTSFQRNACIKRHIRERTRDFVKSRNRNGRIFSVWSARYTLRERVAHMKIPIILVVVSPGNWAAEHSARKLPRNGGEYGAISWSVGYVCAELFQPQLIIGFSSSSNTDLIRLFRWAAESPVPCFAVKQVCSRQCTGVAFIDSRGRVHVFPRMIY